MELRQNRRRSQRKDFFQRIPRIYQEVQPMIDFPHNL